MILLGCCGGDTWLWEKRKQAKKMPWTSALLRNHGAPLPCVDIACLPAEDEQAPSETSNPHWRVKSEIHLSDHIAHQFRANLRKAGATCPPLHWSPRSLSTPGRYLATFGWRDNLRGGSKVVKAPLHQAGQPHLGLLLNRAPSRVTARTSPEGGIMMGDTGGDAGVKCAGFSK
jgi:hypothetical protein